MAKALKPFGLRVMGGHNFCTRQVIMNATHAAVFPGAPIIRSDSGCVVLASNTASAQVKIEGIANQYLAANTGGALEVIPADKNTKFLIQSKVTGENYTSEAAVYGESYELDDLDVAGDTDLIRAKGTLGDADGTNGCVIVRELASLPENSLDATTYPIFVVEFLPRAVAEDDV